MNIIRITPNESGAYPPIQTSNATVPPEGMAIWPDSIDTAVFYAHNGFVKLTFDEVEVVVGQEAGKDGVKKDVVKTVPRVAGCEPNIEAWEAWKATLPAEPDPVDLARAEKEKEMSAACNEAIVAGMDVETSVGVEHFSLQETDQINLTTAQAAIQGGAAAYPYHADGSLCRLFSADEINAICAAATQHKLYHTTLCNHLLTWARRAETVEEIEGITYGAENLPEDLAANMAAIFSAAASV